MYIKCLLSTILHNINIKTKLNVSKPLYICKHRAVDHRSNFVGGGGGT